MVEPPPLAAERPPSNRAFPVLPALAALIAVSVVVRSILAWKHGAPRLFPDEYIYAALGQSLAHGHLAIRGGPVWFPGVFEPVVAAPIWGIFSAPFAYHAVQVENAVVASLASLPVYALARKLNLAPLTAFVAAVYAVVVPELVVIAYISSDVVGYTLALTAVALGVWSLEQPTRKAQIWFAIVSTLAAFTRAEYVALAGAYVVAAAIIDRRRITRHWIALLSVLGAIAVALVGAFGYYTDISSGGSGLSKAYVGWFFAQPFLCALVLGVAIVPGAIAALTVTRTRAEQAFAMFAGAFGVLILAESARFATATSAFKERYVFVVIALVPVAFGLYIKNGRPRRWLVLALAAAIAVAASRVPISGYAEGKLKIDSQSLFAISSLYGTFSVSTVSLLVALGATLGAIAAALLAYRGSAAIATGGALLVAVAATVGATHFDLNETSNGLKTLLPHDLRWVDHHANGDVSAIETANTPPQNLLYALFFNPSIKHELLLGAAVPTDAFRAPTLEVKQDGSLVGVHGDVVVNDFGTATRFVSGARLAQAAHFTLWRAPPPIRLRYTLEGSYWDGWLNPTGRLRVWPVRQGDGTVLTFRLSLPQDWPFVSRVRLGRASFVVRPGTTIAVSCDSGAGPLDIDVDAGRTAFDSGQRSLSVRLTRIAVRDHPPAAVRRPLCSKA